MNGSILKKLLAINVIVMLFIFITNTNLNKISANSNSDSQSNQTIEISYDEFIEDILNLEVSNAEKEYLSEKGTMFSYSDKIPVSNITFHNVTGTYVIETSEYSTLLSSGETVTWIPYEAKMLDTKASVIESDGKYFFNFSSDIDSDIVTVSYKMVINFDKTLVNDLINEAYNVAHYYVTNNIIENKTKEYEALYNQYLLDEKAYDQYLKDLETYNTNILLYEEYQTVMKDYNDKLESYNQEYSEYLTDLEKYNNDVKDFNDYQLKLETYRQDLVKYNQYLTDKDTFDEKYDLYLKEYETYSENMLGINYSLNTMNLCTTYMTSLNRNLYNAILGDAVTQVLERKSELTLAGVENAAVEKAALATDNLKKILKYYFSLTTNEQRYLYYYRNYSAIKNNFIALLQTLEYIYSGHALVRAYIKTMDRTYQFEILLAQLYLVCHGMTEGKIANYKGTKYIDSSWTVNSKTPTQILDGFTYEDQEEYNQPTMSYYPAEPVKPTLEVVEKPVEPTEVAEPGLPPVEPTKPTKPDVDEVEEPIKPTEVLKPIEPIKYVPDNKIINLINEYNEGTLKERNLYQTDITYEANTTVSKKLTKNEISINFYDSNNEMIGTYVTDEGSYIIYDKNIPTKESDFEYETYEFVGWYYEDGQKLDLNNVTRSGNVYPKFEGKSKQKYIITFDIDGNTFESEYSYGDLPNYTNEVSKPSTISCYYEFTGWDKDITEVTENTTYKAVFKEIYFVTTQNDNSQIKGCEIEVFNDDLNVRIDNNYVNNFAYDKIDISHILKEYSNKNINIISNVYEIKINQKELEKMISNNSQFITIIIKKDIVDEYKYEIILEANDKDGNKLSCDMESTITITASFDREHSSVYYLDELTEVKDELSIITSEQVRLVKVKTNTTYVIYPKYNIDIISNDYVHISINEKTAKYNQNININLTYNEKDVKIKNIVIYNISTGQIVNVDDDQFNMPRGNVKVEVKHEFVLYNVTFMYDGEIISKSSYRYNDEVLMPSDPQRSTDGNYEYKFIRWDKEVTNVKEDIIYNAIFEKIKVEEIKFSKYNFISIAITGGIILSLTSVVILIIIKKKRKK